MNHVALGRSEPGVLTLLRKQGGGAALLWVRDGGRFDLTGHDVRRAHPKESAVVQMTLWPDAAPAWIELLVQAEGLA